ncbi:large neutral amino acids transporter small subunit 1-like [Babylonia areolata]|uniref:large neutral amino acids transporter small subunit 1-like n=1 Tax=Babylonia areolata TaxID=304850 RepID=UPI003FD0223A
MPADAPMAQKGEQIATSNGGPKTPAVCLHAHDERKLASETSPKTNTKVELKKSIKFTGALAILLGNIGGGSIFIAPTTVLKLTGSPGLAVLMWCLGGLVTMSVAVSVCELALLLPRAGGPYFYTLQVFGDIPGFIVLWGFVILIAFPSWALSAYTGSLYILSIFFTPDCPPPESAVKLLAAWLLVGLVAVNCTYTSYVTKLQSFFTLAKAAAMLTIIIAALTTVGSESSQDHLAHFMDNSNTDIGRLCMSLFAGYFSFGGWQIITVLIEEVHNPVKDVPKALVLSFLVAISLFVLTNVAYYMVLSPDEALQSDAVAMAFGKRLHPTLPYILATMVTLCCVGGINVVVMGQPRILYAAARLGHMPRLFAMLHHRFLTPWPATFTMFLGALYMLLSGTVSSLINYISLYVCIMLLILLLALLYLRYSQPHRQQPYRVPMPVLLGQVLLTFCLIAVSVYEKPHELGGCLLLLASAIPVYLIFVRWSWKPKAFICVVDGITNFIQRVLHVELPTMYTSRQSC